MTSQLTSSQGVPGTARGLIHQPDTLRFGRQRTVRDDTSDLIALFCSRRAGKTEEFVFEAVEAMSRDAGACVIFIGLSAKSARQIFYARFKRLNHIHRWGLTFNDQSLSVTHPKTLSTCLVFGSDHRDDIEKISGLSRVTLLIIDEAGLWRPSLLQYVIEEIAGPALEDIPGSRTILGGTPGRILTGYWYDITTRKVPAYSVHSWSMRDNPYMPPGAEERVLAKFGWTRDTPEFRRQYLGEWVMDSNSLVFSRFDSECIASSDWPSTNGSILSVDFGVVHATGFIVLSYAVNHDIIKVVYAQKKYGMAPTEVADEIMRLKEKYGCSRVIGDLGGMGKAYAQEMLVRHQVYIEPADKRDKLALIETANDAFGQRKLVVDSRQEDLISELRTLQWDELHTDIAEGQSDDMTDALCYGVQRMLLAATPLPTKKTDEPVLPKPRPRPYWDVGLGAR